MMIPKQNAFNKQKNVNKRTQILMLIEQFAS